MSHRYPDTHVLYRNLRKDFPLALRGQGCWLYDEAGKAYLDGVGGAFVASLGHGVAEIADALASQARQVAYVNGTQFTTGAAEALAAELAARAPGDLDQVYFLSSGSEAVEAALKIARQYWVESGCPGKHKVLSLTPGYHGNTMLALAASGRPRYQTYFKQWLVPVPRVPAPYAYRCQCHGAGSCPSCTGEALEDAILAEGPDTVAVFIGEPVGGSSTGATVPKLSYWARVREICDRHDVLWIADEVLSGAGRTGTWSALEPYGAVPDLLTMGKGITGGYVPLSAVVAPRRVVDVIAAGSGAVLHAQTFSHHPVLCAAGLAAIRHLDAHQLVDRCHRMGPVFHRKLEALRDLPFVGDVRGRGLLAGVEFVEDKDTRAPFPRQAKFAERFTEAAQDAGLIVWPNTGQANGTDGDLAMLAPPFVVSDDELDQIVSRFATALDRTPPGP